MCGIYRRCLRKKKCLYVVVIYIIIVGRIIVIVVVDVDIDAVRKIRYHHLYYNDIISI